MDPFQEYTARRDRRRAEEALLQKQFVRIGNFRLVVFLSALSIAWLAFRSHLISPWLLAIPIIAFIALAVWHQRVIRQRSCASRALEHYVEALQRLQDKWSGKGETGERFTDENHVYANDLNVFGRGSLFQLISRARTGPGERTLADWLLGPANRAETVSRQGAVHELSPLLDLREDMALLGEDVRSGVHPEKVAAWSAAAAEPFSSWSRPLAFALSFTAVTTFLAFFAHFIPLWPFVVVLACNLALMFTLRERVERVAAKVETPAQDLRILSLVLERLEREKFGSPRMRQIQDWLQVEGWPASKRIARLGRWMEWLDSNDHLLVRVIRPILLWNEQCALAIEAWRRENGALVGQWLNAVGQFEALSSLASLAFERPHWAFPTLLENGALFEAQALRHPLLATDRCVPNDVVLGAPLGLLIISGSNMSGKSTLLRAVGLNAVLAWAGAPVSASTLRISPLQVGASLRVSDSLQDNRSRFFAEITRLRRIVELSKVQPPVLFLLDELLSGTNSHDRKIGASAIVSNLVRDGAIGFITTHDLALAAIERDLGNSAVNAHFEDSIIDGVMEFDYRLRPGIVTRSNALELMRSIGLNV